ncbi:MAG: VOC family protein [bacterium]
MDILASRYLLHPRDYDRSVRFYRDLLVLHSMREFGSGRGRGIVLFLGGGHLEITGQSEKPASPTTELWLQVRDVAAVERKLVAEQVPILETATRKPWGLVELRAEDPDGLRLVFVEVPPDHPLRRDQRS